MSISMNVQSSQYMFTSDNINTMIKELKTEMKTSIQNFVSNLAITVSETASVLGKNLNLN